MKNTSPLKLTALVWLVLTFPAAAGSPVIRTLVRDAYGRARIAYVRASDQRILYPRVMQQVERSGGHVEYRPALSSSYRPEFFPGYGVYRQNYGYESYGIPGRRFYPVGNGYPNYYRPIGNYGVDSILYHGNRGKFGIPGYGLPGGAFPRPVVRPQLSGLPPARYSGNVKER